MNGTTPAQTIGPFFSHALPFKEGPNAVLLGTPDAFWIRGTVFDGAGEPVPDALIESWQADPAGHFDHPEDPGRAPAPPGFRGFSRCPTDESGRYGLLTVKPGPVPGPDGRLQAPHLALSVFARGLLHRLVTRVYFADEAAANEADPVLSTVPEPARGTLIAAVSDDGYTFDIRLQGEHETVFFAI